MQDARQRRASLSFRRNVAQRAFGHADREDRRAVRARPCRAARHRHAPIREDAPADGEMTERGEIEPAALEERQQQRRVIGVGCRIGRLARDRPALAPAIRSAASMRANSSACAAVSRASADLRASSGCFCAASTSARAAPRSGSQSAPSQCIVPIIVGARARRSAARMSRSTAQAGAECAAAPGRDAHSRGRARACSHAFPRTRRARRRSCRRSGRRRSRRRPRLPRRRPRGRDARGRPRQR